MKHSKSLKRLLKFYDLFCKAERLRIIEGHKIYGEDWKVKSNRYEHWQEILDEWGYEFLHDAQQKYVEKRKYFYYDSDGKLKKV